MDADIRPAGDGRRFRPLALKPEERKLYKYDGPEIIYTFWAKHGPCQVTGCGHRTPIMTTPVIALKTISLKAWGDRACPKCKGRFDLEPRAVRMAPDVPLMVAEGEDPFAVLEADDWTTCPHCGHSQQRSALGKPSKKKKISLILLVHPEWMSGSPRTARDGTPYGGTAQDDAASTALWNKERARHLRLLEVRGVLPDEVTCPETRVTFRTDETGGNVPGRSTFTCAACGTKQPLLAAIKATGKTGAWSQYAIQAYSRARDEAGAVYGGDILFQQWTLAKSMPLSPNGKREKMTILAHIGLDPKFPLAI